MVNRKKRLERGIDSLEKQIRLHEKKLQDAQDVGLVEYYRKEIVGKKNDLEEKKRLLKKGG